MQKQENTEEKESQVKYKLAFKPISESVVCSTGLKYNPYDNTVEVKQSTDKS